MERQQGIGRITARCRRDDRVKRRLFIVAGLWSATTGHAVAQQTQRIRRIGVLTPGSPADSQIEAFRAGLRDYGYIDGKTVAIDWKFSGGSFEPLPGLARQLV